MSERRSVTVTDPRADHATDGDGTSAAVPFDGAGSDVERSTGHGDVPGALDVRVKAIESIVLHASAGVPGTRKVDSALSRLRRNALPSAKVTLRGDRAWIELDVAATWPCRAERLADNVRRQVFTEASELSAVPIERLDVTLHVVEPSESGRAR